MKVLLDECVDWRLLRDLDGHDVKTVRRWEHVKNGELLRIAATQFDAFVTVDSNPAPSTERGQLRDHDHRVA